MKIFVVVKKTVKNWMTNKKFHEKLFCPGLLLATLLIISSEGDLFRLSTIAKCQIAKQKHNSVTFFSPFSFSGHRSQGKWLMDIMCGSVLLF